MLPGTLRGRCQAYFEVAIISLLFFMLFGGLFAWEGVRRGKTNQHRILASSYATPARRPRYELVEAGIWWGVAVSKVEKVEKAGHISMSKVDNK